MQVREIWNHKVMTASGTLAVKSGCSGGFLCTTSGTLQVTAGESAGGATIVPAFSVVAGTWYPLPFHYFDGAYAVLTTAQGVFAVGK